MKHRLLSLLISFLTAINVFGVPGVLNHQGRIAVDGVNVDGNAFFKFALIDPGVSGNLWANDGTASGEPVVSLTIPVTKGHYSVLLGSSHPILPGVFSLNDNVHLRIWFSVDDVTFAPLSPDRRITPVGYAFSAASLVPGYETGAGSEMELEGSVGNTLTFSAEYSASFLNSPVVTFGSGWSVDSANSGGFSASASFNNQTIDSVGGGGSHPSLAVINGRPAIAYRDDSEGALYFTRSVDSSGEGWPTSAKIKVDGATRDVGGFASMTEVNGHPAISYYDQSRGDLLFIRANNENGTSWPATAITVDGVSGNVGRDTSLAMVGGVPAIAYQSPNTGEILYAWAADPSGVTWNVTSIDGSLGGYRQHPSLAEVNGKPAIAFYNQTDGDLRYAYLSGSDPSLPADWAIVDVEVTGDVGKNPSLAVISGIPAVSYDDGLGGVRYAFALDSAGVNWTAPQPVGNGRSSSLAEISGQPAISFYDAINGDLKLYLAGNVLTVDGAQTNVGDQSSLASVAGLPAIAYLDTSSAELKYAALPIAEWNASDGDAEPILASGVKSQGVTEEMLAEDLGVWKKSGDDFFYDEGKIGIGRQATTNALEVEGNASKTTAGSWLSNSDRRIKKDVREIEGALKKIQQIRLVEFEYTTDYRKAHPGIPARRYPNVIAQEYAKVFPDWVQSSGERLPGDGEEILQVDTYPINIYTAAAVQELAKENAELRKRLERLERLLLKDR
jgi:hypothetical protein